MHYLVTLIALIGATLLVVRGSLFAPIRRFALFRCAQCFGAWVGAAGGGSGLLSAGHGRLLDAAVVGAAVSLLALSADAMLLRLLGGEPDHDDSKEGTGQ